MRRRCEVAAARVRPLDVVVGGPARELRAGMVQAEEQRFVQKLVAHAAVEALAEGVLHWFAWRDVMPADGLGLTPGEISVRGELLAVVEMIVRGRPYHASHERRQLADHSLAGDRRAGDREQTLARGMIDNIEDPEAPPAGELVLAGPEAS